MSELARSGDRGYSFELWESFAVLSNRCSKALKTYYGGVV
jgi:hypothetical protein